MHPKQGLRSSSAVSLFPWIVASGAVDLTPVRPESGDNRAQSDISVGQVLAPVQQQGNQQR